MLNHSIFLECFCYFRKDEGCPESQQGLYHKGILFHLPLSLFSLPLFTPESAEGFIRMSASIVTHWGSPQEVICLIFPNFVTVVWNRRMQRYYEMVVNQTQHVPLQPSGSSREINGEFLHMWTDDLPPLAGRNQAPAYMSAQWHHVRLHQSKHWAWRRLIQQLRRLCKFPSHLNTPSVTVVLLGLCRRELYLRMIHGDHTVW